MAYRIEQFRTGGWFFGKVDGQQVERTLNGYEQEGWKVVSSSALNRFFGESHHMVVILHKDDSKG